MARDQSFTRHMTRYEYRNNSECRHITSWALAARWGTETFSPYCLDALFLLHIRSTNSAPRPARGLLSVSSTHYTARRQGRARMSSRTAASVSSSHEAALFSLPPTRASTSAIRQRDPPSAASVSSSPSGLSPMFQCPSIDKRPPAPPSALHRGGPCHVTCPRRQGGPCHVPTLSHSTSERATSPCHVTCPTPAPSQRSLPRHLSTSPGWTCFIPTLSALSHSTPPLRNACLSLKLCSASF